MAGHPGPLATVAMPSEASELVLAVLLSVLGWCVLPGGLVCLTAALNLFSQGQFRDLRALAFPFQASRAP